LNRRCDLDRCRDLNSCRGRSRRCRRCGFDGREARPERLRWGSCDGRRQRRDAVLQVGPLRGDGCDPGRPAPGIGEIGEERERPDGEDEKGRTSPRDARDDGQPEPSLGPRLGRAGFGRMNCHRHAVGLLHVVPLQQHGLGNAAARCPSGLNRIQASSIHTNLSESPRRLNLAGRRVPRTSLAPICSRKRS